jgi:hypothetical protein
MCRRTAFNVYEATDWPAHNGVKTMKAFWIGGAVAAAIGIATLTGVAMAQQTGSGGHAMHAGWGGGGGWGGHGGAGMMRDPARMFALVDANGDGFIDRDELTNMRWRFVQALDADNDGVITRQEAEANVGRWRDAMRTAFGDGSGGWGGGQGRGALMWLSRQDTTGSGRVTRQQLAADPVPLMRLLDRDTDGRISRAELDVFVEAMRSMRPNRT